MLPHANGGDDFRRQPGIGRAMAQRPTTMAIA